MTVTDRQSDFIRSLFDERKETLTGENYSHILQMPMSTSQQASKLIDALKRVPKDVPQDAPTIVTASTAYGINKYSNPCFTCQHPVRPGEGYYFSQDGKYHSHHRNDECSSDPPPQVVAIDPGIYKLDTGVYVIMEHHPEYGMVGKSWDGSKFKRLNRAKHIVAEKGRPATSDEIIVLSSMVGDIGKATSTCQFCMRPLTDGADGHSIDRGYGPVCARNYGLPWGIDTVSNVS